MFLMETAGVSHKKKGEETPEGPVFAHRALPSPSSSFLRPVVRVGPFRAQEGGEDRKVDITAPLGPHFPVTSRLGLHGRESHGNSCPVEDTPWSPPCLLRMGPLGLGLSSPWPPLPVPSATCARSHLPPPQGTDSESEDVPPQHSFVNHYLSDPTYYNSWKRRAPHRYEAVAGGEGPQLHTVVTTQSAVFAPAGPGARTALTGFSSFV